MPPVDRSLRSHADAEMSIWTQRGHFICEMDNFKKNLQVS